MNVPPAAPPLARQLEHAADALQAVRGGRTLADALTRCPVELRPGVQALAFHALRWLGSAERARVQLAPRTPAPAVDALLLVALALLWPDEKPPYSDHVLVDQAVTAARRRTPAAAGFVNAVLRRFLRERDAVVQAVRQHPLGAWNHPPWWVERVQRDWPGCWQELLLEANRHPPMTLRVNRRRASAASYLERLAAAGRAASLLPGFDDALVLAEPCPVQRLPGFAEGEVSVQDAAAQRAAPLLLSGAPLGPGARVLDACAAPGGKTAHLLELAEIDLLALDADPQRLVRVQETLARLQLQAGPGVPAAPGRVELRAGDARRPADWWDGRAFDAILLDAPCTASGIVRRHPDVRWLRRADDIAALARIQAEMLDALWPLLARGGCLLYATCSIFKAEGVDQIDAFLQRCAAGSATLLRQSPGHLLPGPDNPTLGAVGRSPAPEDGFFYALIRKT